MSIFMFINLFGGLALFLYGMRLMGESLKESSSSTLKKAMESVTNSSVKAFLLGIAVTAIIQSSTATIVITSGLVAAGIITLRQSLGIIIGANVGTTVTGQIIRLLDINAAGTSWLQFFQPSTLAPVALIIGIVFVMFCKFKSSDTAGNIALGFGILFTGLLNMTSSVNSLSSTGVFETVFSSLGESPLLGYISGAGVAFILQSSSATIGILQAFSASGQLTFKAIYAVLVGIYLGDCVTTAIVCSIGAKADARRVGIVNILFNLSETVVVLVVVGLAHRLGLINDLWNRTVTPGIIANTNTVFNLGCAILLFPMINTYEKLSRKIVRDEPEPEYKYADKLTALNPAFAKTPAIALNACYEALCTMLDVARENIFRAFTLLEDYSDEVYLEVESEENNIDILSDALSAYLAVLSSYLNTDLHVKILDQYYKVNVEFERLSDHSLNIAEYGKEMNRKGLRFSDAALYELHTIEKLIAEIMDSTSLAFKKRDVTAAKRIEPLEQVTDDAVEYVKDMHLKRFQKGLCTVEAGSIFLNLLSDMERISDVCSNVGVATIARVYPEEAGNAHEYTSKLHVNDEFVKQYGDKHDEYFGQLHREPELKIQTDAPQG